MIVPRVNVDGSAADRRVLASGADANRDHLLLSQPEVRALHAAMWRPAARRRLRPSRIQCRPALGREVQRHAGSDVMILEATNPSIPKALADDRGQPLSAGARGRHPPGGPVQLRLCHDQCRHGRQARVARRHRTGHRAQRLRPARRRLLPDRDAGRRDRLAELRASRLDALSARQGRAGGHRRRSRGLLDRVAAARAAVGGRSIRLIITHEAGERDIDLPLIDAESGAPMPTPVRPIDSRDLAGRCPRRPAGYLVLRGTAGVAERLGLNEVSVREVAAEANSLSRPTRSTAPKVARVATRSIRTSWCGSRSAAGRSPFRPAPVVPMAQPAAGIAAAALEPIRRAATWVLGSFPWNPTRPRRQFIA